jgi:hypothetical protein
VDSTVTLVEEVSTAVVAAASTAVAVEADSTVEAAVDTVAADTDKFLRQTEIYGWQHVLPAVLFCNGFV